MAPVSSTRIKTGTIPMAPNLYNLGYNLNNILLKIGDQIVEGGSYIKSIGRGVRKSISDKIVESSGVVKDDPRLTGVKPPKVKLEGLEVSDPMTGTVSRIDKSNIGEYQASIAFTRQKAKEMGLDPDAAELRHIYRLTEGNQAVRDQYFTPEQQAVLSEIQANAYAAPRNLQPTLQGDGLIGEPNALYEHAVTDFDRIPEEFRNVKVETPNGVVEFKTEAEARAFIDLEKRSGRMNNEQAGKANVGIFKHRNDARFNQYRSLDPVIQLIGYADDTGRTYANKEILNTLEGWRQDPKIGKHLKGYFFDNTSALNSRKDVRMTLMDIYDVPQNRAEKLLQGADSAVTYMKLASFGQNIAQGTTYSTLTNLGKALAMVLRQRSLAPLKDISPDIKPTQRSTIHELEREGFVTKSEYLGNDMSAIGKAAIDIGTAQPIENFWRSRAAISLMRNELLRNQKEGGLSAKLDTGTKWKNDEEVIAAWNKFVKEGDPSNVQVSRANILSDLDSFGDASNQGRYDAPFFGRASKKFKSFFATTVGRTLADTKNVIDAIANARDD